MVEDYLTDKTDVLTINEETLIDYDEEKEEEYELIAQKISKETGVPKKDIYDKELQIFRISNWHKINRKYYYYKNSGIFFLNELLGEIISEYFDLDTVHYKIAKLSSPGKKAEYGIVSKNVCDKKFTYEHLDLDKCGQGYYRRNLKILNNIRVLCRSDEEYMMLLEDFKKMIIRSFYSDELDIKCKNFYLKISSDSTKLILYDYECSYMGLFGVYELETDFGMFDVQNSITQDLLKNDLKFQELLHKLMNADINNFMNIVEERHKIVIPSEKKEYLKKYECNRKSLILKNKLIK